MATPSWSILNLILPSGQSQKIIFVFHGDIADRSKFTPSMLPVCLYLGRGARTWRSDYPPELTPPSFIVFAESAVRARQKTRDPLNHNPNLNPNFLQIPKLKYTVVPSWGMMKLKSGVNYIRNNYMDILSVITKIVLIITLLMVFKLFISPAALPQLRDTLNATRAPAIRDQDTAILASDGSTAVPVIPITETKEIPISLEPEVITHFRSNADPISPGSGAAPIQPDRSYTLIQTMPVCRDLRELVSNHHTTLHSNWAYIHGIFAEETKNVVAEVNQSITPFAGADEPDILDILSKLNNIQQTFGNHREIQKRWDGQALTNWINLATWWSWDDPDFDPEAYLSARMPANAAALATSIFDSTVAPRNARIHNLVDEVVCSGYEGHLPWPGMVAHYTEARNHLASANAQLALLEKIINEMRQKQWKTDSMVQYTDSVLRAAENARQAASLGMNAAHAMTEGLATMCERIKKSAENNWRISVQDNADMIRYYLRDEADPVEEERGLFHWIAWKPEQARPVTRDGKEVSGLWLASETNSQVAEIMVDAVLVVWNTVEGGQGETEKEEVANDTQMAV